MWFLRKLFRRLKEAEKYNRTKQKWYVPKPNCNDDEIQLLSNVQIRNGK